MKNTIWILFSLILHSALVAGLWFLNSNDLKIDPEQIVDLTLNSPPAGQIRNIKTIPSQAPTKEAPPKTKVLDTASSNSTSEAQTSQSESNEGTSPNEEIDSLPTKWSEVTRFPKVTKEYKATYPEQAKKAGIDGPVVLEVIIDSKGRVRDIILISGPGHGLNESAMEALKKFEFYPAQKGNEFVAVKIRYTYRFKLDVN